MLTDQKIEELIRCRKRIIEAVPLKGMAEDKKSVYIQRKNLKLQSVDDPYEFDVFIRHNTKLIEQFSIGLRFKTDDKTIGKITLLRYNGAHGQTDWSTDKHHSLFHIHKISEVLLNNGVCEPRIIEITDTYSTFDSAVNTFGKHVSIVNFFDYFPNLSDQLQLFGEGVS